MAHQGTGPWEGDLPSGSGDTAVLTTLHGSHEPRRPQGAAEAVSEGDSGERGPPGLSAPYQVTAFEPSVADTADSRVPVHPKAAGGQNVTL